MQNRLPTARAAKAAGFEVHVATRTTKDGHAIEGEGFILHSIPFRRGSLAVFDGIKTILALRGIERRIKPDIIHSTGLQCCFYCSLAMRGLVIPQVNAITGLGYLFTSANRKTRLLTAIIGWMLPTLLNRRTSVVLTENPDDQRALAHLGVHQDRLLLFPGSGVDTNRLQPLLAPELPITFGFVGRLLADKGIRILVSAHQILRDEGYNFQLLIAGNPDLANPASISFQEIQEWTRRPGITWLGYIDDVVLLWKRCHFAVLPSRREGLPISLLEAAACGRAMIATDAPGCREIVIHDATGLLVPVDDPKALAAAILRLANSPELRRRYAQGARDLVVSKFSGTIVGSLTVGLYDRLVPSAANSERTRFVERN